MLDPKTTQLDFDELQQRLAEQELEYGMTSAECEQRYFNGELGDSQPIIRWIHDYQSYKILLKKKKAEKAVNV